MPETNYLTTGKWLYAIAIFGLGVLHFTSGHFIQNFPVAAWMPMQAVLSYLTGLVLVLAGLAILTKRYFLLGTYLAVGIFMVFQVFLLIPELVMGMNKAGQYTFASENFMFVSGALMLCGNRLIKSGKSDKGSRIFMIGKYLFAITLLDFSIEHLTAVPYVVSIIPGWIPWKTFWAYFVTCAFFASSISLFINKLVKLNMLLLFLMFFLWICLLHVPQVAADSGSAGSWTGLLVPVGVCGIILIVLGSTWIAFRQKEG